MYEVKCLTAHQRHQSKMHKHNPRDPNDRVPVRTKLWHESRYAQRRVDHEREYVDANSEACQACSPGGREEHGK